MEVILVMVIFSIGAAIGVPKMQRVWDVRKLERSASSLESIANAIRIYGIENNVISSAGTPGVFNNNITSRSFTDLLTALETKGLLNQADLTPHFCYSWKVVPSTDSKGEITGLGEIQSSVKDKNGVCSTDPEEQAVYRIDFTNGRGYDQKIIGTQPPKTRLSNSDNF